MSSMTLLQHAAYLACVAAACYVQNLTGFAFGLVLLGLAGLTQVAALPDVTNVVSVLVLVNAIGLFRSSRPQFDRDAMVPVMATSLPGVLGGVLLLGWLGDNVVVVLELLLGLTIFVCAGVLLFEAKARPARSSRVSFAGVGLVSGVLGGLFSTAGPPLVFHFYRQPLPFRVIRDTLVAIFAVNAVVRLALMAGTGRFGSDALWLSIEAVPLVLLQTRLMARWPPRWQPRTIKLVVCVLLVFVAAGLVVPALQTVSARSL